MRVLLCEPKHFRINWEDAKINPWMRTGKQPDLSLAFRQYRKWEDLLSTLGVEILKIGPRQGLGDQVFTANVAWGTNLRGTKQKVFVMANFAHPHRRQEAELAAKWFAQHHMNVYFLETAGGFEGQGDLITTKRQYIYCRGRRNSLEAMEEIERVFKLDRPVITLELKDPRFYHGDLCLRYSIHRDAILFYPGAFTDDSLRKIAALKVRRLKEAREEFVVQDLGEQGRNFPLNGCYIGKVETFPWNEEAAGFPPAIRNWIEDDGGEVALLDFSQFGLSGAGHRCVTLFLD